MQVVAAEFGQRGGTVLEPRAAREDELAGVHDADSISLVRETAGRATALDPDTYTSPETYAVACLGAGAAIGAVDHVLDGPRGSRALALVRPPGHHAERNRAMGFCLFNNIAIAAVHARSRGLHRIAIVDYDVHHCNGTQWSFYDDPSVLVLSSHQYPFYPGTGGADEIGTGAGLGYTVNLPLAAGAAGADYERAYDAIAWPILKAFKPELILVSAGFDAYLDDPLAGMRLEADDFGRITSRIVAIADEYCDGRVAAVTEGGYHLKGIADSLRAVIAAFEGDRAAVQGHPVTEAAPRGDATVAAVKPHLTPHWTL